MNLKVFKRFFLFAVVVIFFIHSPGWGANLEVHIIDVGQGDCQLIISPTGKTVLIDTCTGTKATSVVLPYLDNLGITSIDYLVATHYDRDHIAGVDEVIEGLGGISKITYAVYDRGGSYDSSIFNTYLNAVEQKRETIEPEDVIDIGGCATLTCIASGGKTKNGAVYHGSDDDDDDELGVVLILSYCDFQMYFGGDIGEDMEPYIGFLSKDMDVYKVSHHGSKYSSTQSFLDEITPEVSTISVGNNSYDHPTSDVLNRLASVNSYVYQTEEGNREPSPGNGEVAYGSFKIETDGSTYNVSGSSLNEATYQTDGSHDSSDCCQNDVLFSEVLYDSWVYYDTEGEWIELYNPTPSTVDLSLWRINDTDHTYTIPSGTTIGPQCYLIIADGQSAFYQEYGCYPHLSNLSLQLNNNGGYLKLKSSEGTVIDQVAWESGGSNLSGWGSTSKPYANEGKSIVRFDVNNDSDTYADWLSNRTPAPNCNGTPEINLSSKKLYFKLNIGETGSKKISISNSGCGTLNWTVTDNANWMSCSPVSGKNSGEITVYVFSPDPGKGSYTGTVTIEAKNASNSPQEVTVYLEINDCGKSEITLNRSQLNFGACNGLNSSSQSFLVSNTGCGTLNWTVTDNANWISCSPEGGKNSGSVSVYVDSYGLGTGTYTGTVTVKDPNASNYQENITVNLNVFNYDNYPFGTFETPVDGSTVRSSIPVTGWVLDDIEVVSVKIYNGSSFVGDALLVEGARPDVEQAYPGYPMNYKAGWGYMMLTNFLPNGGNGIYTIYAKAADSEGKVVTLGSKTINVDNANAVKPFGAIDTPTQGGAAAGSNFINWGWVLTPQPKSIPTDGSTIRVYVDGVNLGHPVYNIFRSDIASLFPGFANSNGPAGYFSLDTTAFENGVHTIQWTATDNAGNTDGIGSRYFSVQNTSGSSVHAAMSSANAKKKIEYNTNPFSKINADSFEPVRIKLGYNEKINPYTLYPDNKGTVSIQITELERVEIHLGQSYSYYNGYLKVGNQLKKLPIGSYLDSKKGVFYWQPGPAFIGDYEFVFIKNQHSHLIKKNITINIVPHNF